MALKAILDFWQCPRQAGEGEGRQVKWSEPVYVCTIDRPQSSPDRQYAVQTQNKLGSNRTNVPAEYKRGTLIPRGSTAYLLLEGDEPYRSLVLP